MFRLIKVNEQDKWREEVQVPQYFNTTLCGMQDYAVSVSKKSPDYIHYEIFEDLGLDCHFICKVKKGWVE